MSEFASEGFDIRGGSGNVVHEIGGTETPVVNNDKPIEPPKSDEAERPLHATLKEEGNSLFKVGDYGGALDFYLRAVDEGEKSCVDESSEDPVPSFGEDLLHLLHEHKEYERKVKARERRENEEGERKEERRKARKERGEEVRLGEGSEGWSGATAAYRRPQITNNNILLFASLLAASPVAGQTFPAPFPHSSNPNPRSRELPTPSLLALYLPQ